MILNLQNSDFNQKRGYDLEIIDQGREIIKPHGYIQLVYDSRKEGDSPFDHDIKFKYINPDGTESSGTTNISYSQITTHGVRGDWIERTIDAPLYGFTNEEEGEMVSGADVINNNMIAPLVDYTKAHTFHKGDIKYVKHSETPDPEYWVLCNGQTIEQGHPYYDNADYFATKTTQLDSKIPTNSVFVRNTRGTEFVMYKPLSTQFTYQTTANGINLYTQTISSGTIRYINFIKDKWYMTIANDARTSESYYCAASITDLLNSPLTIYDGIDYSTIDNSLISNSEHINSYISYNRRNFNGLNLCVDYTYFGSNLSKTITIPNISSLGSVQYASIIWSTYIPVTYGDNATANIHIYLLHDGGSNLYLFGARIPNNYLERNNIVFVNFNTFLTYELTSSSLSIYDILGKKYTGGAGIYNFIFQQKEYLCQYVSSSTQGHINLWKLEDLNYDLETNTINWQHINSQSDKRLACTYGMLQGIYNNGLIILSTNQQDNLSDGINQYGSVLGYHYSLIDSSINPILFNSNIELNMSTNPTSWSTNDVFLPSLLTALQGLQNRIIGSSELRLPPIKYHSSITMHKCVPDLIANNIPLFNTYFKPYIMVQN